VRLVCWLLFSAIASTAHDPSTAAKELLTRSGGAAIKASTVRLEGREQTELVAPGLSQTVSASFSFASGDAGKMRWERRAGDSHMIQVADGHSVWTYVPSTKDYSRAPEQTQQAADVVERLKFGRDATHFKDAHVERDEALPFAGKPVACTVVQASYTAMPGFPAARDIVRTVWIAKGTDLVLRDTWEFSMNAGAALAPRKSRITTDYTLIEWGIPLAEEQFVVRSVTGR
jgi:hypothetical protein